MSSNNYFRSYRNYFWQWEDGGDVISIPGGSTIAYRDFVARVIDHLSGQGVPPFGALLLAILATNADGPSALDTVYSIVLKQPKMNDGEVISESISFLKLLAELPQEYKEGNKRLLVFQAIFERCHYVLSGKLSATLSEDIRLIGRNNEVTTSHKEFDHFIFNRDFRNIALLNRRFRSINDIIERITSLPEIPETLELEEEIVQEEEGEKDFIDQLKDNNHTFYVGSLVPHIWSGLNIPVHSALPSQQSIGGVADLTNKGDFDKLLISEFANDDMVLMSRLANNEALYIRRETPPAKNDLQRIILIDVSLKNWGTPKNVAFATALAIATHPKTDIQCSAFIIGNTYRTVSLDSIDGIIDGLQRLDGSLHGAAGINAFFKDQDTTNREVFVITESSTVRHPEMLKAMHEHKAISYWIYTDVEGNLDVYKTQQNSKRHLQHMQLPLHDLWKKTKRTNKTDKKELPANFPILLRSVSGIKKTLSTGDGEVFQVTTEKTLLRFYNGTSSKGCELAFAELPFVAGEFEMGRMNNGDYLLLLLDVPVKEVTLLNVTTGVTKKVAFNDWRSTPDGIVFHDQKFYHRNQRGVWTIDQLGNIERFDDSVSYSFFAQRNKRLAALQQNYTRKTHSSFKHITKVLINQVGNLVFNSQELLLKQDNHLKLENTPFAKAEIESEKTDEKFVFPDGSVVEISPLGVIILRSSSLLVPHIYMPSIVNSALGVATEDIFAGNEYYNRTLDKISPAEFHKRFICEFIAHIQHSIPSKNN